MANWIAKATSQHKGAFRRAAEKAGKSTEEYAKEKKGAGGTIGKRESSALTLRKLNK